MFKKIILHIGMHKTGTTSIQHMLYSRQRRLLSLGVYFPIFKVRGEVIANQSWYFATVFGDQPWDYHLNVSKGYCSKEKTELLRKDFLAQFLDGVESSEAETLILSAEKISIMNQRELHRIKDLLKNHLAEEGGVSICCFIRNPVEYEQSVIQELVKGGHTLVEAISSAVNSSQNRINRVLSKFERVFGSDSVNVYSFDDVIRSQQGLEQFFWSNVLGLQGKAGSKVKVKNVSLAYESCLIMSQLGYFHGRDINVVLDGSLEQRDRQVLAQIRGTKFLIDETTREKLEELTRADSDYLKSEFGFQLSNRRGVLTSKDCWGEDALYSIARIFSRLSLQARSAVLHVIKEEKQQYEVIDHKKYKLMTRLVRLIESGDVENLKKGMVDRSKLAWFQRAVLFKRHN